MYNALPKALLATIEEIDEERDSKSQLTSHNAQDLNKSRTMRDQANLQYCYLTSQLGFTNPNQVI